MKKLALLFPIAILAGCMAVNQSTLDSTKRQPTANVAIFREGANPGRAFKEIAELSALGFPDEEFKAREEMIKKAKLIGANAIMMQPSRDTGYHFDPFGRSDNKFLYKAVAIVYE